MTVDLTRLFLSARAVGRRATPRPPPPPHSGIVVGLADSGAPVSWPLPNQERAAHAAVWGASGAGKSALVAGALVREVLRSASDADARTCLLVVDPKGDLIELVLQGLAAEAPERLADVRYLDPFSASAFPFNLCRLPVGSTPLDIRAQQLAGLVATISTATGAQAHLGAGARQLDVLAHVLLACLASSNESATVLWALDALSVDRGLLQLANVTTSARARRFCLTAKLGDELRVSSASRLRSAFGATESLERMMAASACVDLAELLGPGRICLVNLGRPVGGLSSLQTFFANLVCRLAVDHLLDRPSPWHGFPVRVVVDEAQVVAPVLADRAEVLLTTGRSRGLSLITMSQGTTLIADASDTLLRVLLTNCRTSFVGRLATADAELMAKSRAPGLGSDETIGAVRSRFAGSVTNLADREFFCLEPGSQVRFRTADVPLALWAQAAAERSAELDGVKRRLGIAPTSANRVSLFDVSPRLRRTRPEAATSTPTATGQEPTAGKPRSRWG